MWKGELPDSMRQNSSSFQYLSYEGGTCKSYHEAILPVTILSPSPASLTAHQQLHCGMLLFVVSCLLCTVNLLSTPSNHQGRTQAQCTVPGGQRELQYPLCSTTSLSHKTCTTVSLGNKSWSLWLMVTFQICNIQGYLSDSVK